MTKRRIGDDTDVVITVTTTRTMTLTEASDYLVAMKDQYGRHLPAMPEFGKPFTAAYSPADHAHGETRTEVRLDRAVQG